MSKHDLSFKEATEKTRLLRSTDFDLVSDEIREQLEINRELITAFTLWNKNADFKAENLQQLQEVQADLIQYFDDHWEYRINNSKGLLKFDQVYLSQVIIQVEWHGGICFHHLMRRCLMFNDEGFSKLRWSAWKAARKR